MHPTATPRTAPAYRRLHKAGWRTNGTRVRVQGVWLLAYYHPSAPTTALVVYPSGRIASV